MSVVNTGSISGDVGGVITQIIQQALAGLITTSAGGDSPKQNTVIDIGEVTGFEEVLDNAITSIVLRNMEERGLVGGGDVTGEGGDGNSPALGSVLGSAKQTAALAQNPAGLVAAGLPFLPHAVLVSFVVSMIPLILEELTKPGGAFDLRFRRIMEKEFNALQARQTSYDIAIGERGVIFQGRAGFINKHGASSNTNSLKLIREGGINKNFLTETDYVDHSQGFDV